MTTVDVLRDVVSDKRGVDTHTLEQVTLLAVEIAREDLLTAVVSSK